MHYIIQENVFREQHYNIIEESIKKLGFSYTKVRLFPFPFDKIVDLSIIPEDNNFNVDDLPDYNTDRKDVFLFGAIKLARIGSKMGWEPGSLMDQNHDYMIYKDYWKDNLLNWDSKIHKLPDNFTWNKDEIKFIRPTKDNKAFTGKLFNQYEWEDMVEHHLHNSKNEQFNENTEIQVGTPKVIYKEIRFWVVDGKVITGSTYRIGTEVIYTDVFEDDAKEFAQQMVDIYQLADAFVIDVCLTDKGWKIVECNCINCAGFYKANMQKVIMELEYFYNK